jgi:hypothetical protein
MKSAYDMESRSVLVKGNNIDNAPEWAGIVILSCEKVRGIGGWLFYDVSHTSFSFKQFLNEIGIKKCNPSGTF